MPQDTKNKKSEISNASKDLIILVVIVIIVLICSYFFNVFSFLIDFIHRYPSAIFFVDEVVSVLFAVSVGLALFAWRRLKELKIETAQRIELQKKLTEMANIKAQTERIVNKQLQNEIELRKSLGN